ncbi:MAG: acyltransferase [Cyanobacteriota bacterium]
MRDPRIDILRISASFAVVWLHTSAYVVTQTEGLSFNWWVGNIADSLSRWCVPIFVMVSGALMIPRLGASTDNSLKFYVTRIKKLLPATICWSIFYIWLVYRQNIGENFVAIIKSIATGTPYYHLWFLYMIFGLYIFAPFIAKFALNSSDTDLSVFLLSAFTLTFIESSVRILAGKGSSTFLSFFIEYIAYFVAGYFLYYRFHLEIRASNYLFLFIFSSLAIALGVGFLYPKMSSISWDLLYNYSNLMVVAMSISVFMLSLKIKPSSNKLLPYINKTSALTLGIYLIHPFWLVLLNKIGLSAILGGAAFGIPFQSISAFILSLGSSYLISRCPYTRCIVSV